MNTQRTRWGEEYFAIKIDAVRVVDLNLPRTETLQEKRKRNYKERLLGLNFSLQLYMKEQKKIPRGSLNLIRLIGCDLYNLYKLAI